MAASSGDPFLVGFVRNRLFERVASAHSSSDGVEREIQFSLPLRQAPRLALVREQFRRASIARLNFARLPYAVCRAVMQFVVDSFQRVCTSWFRSKISDEVLEDRPARIVSDTSAAVVWIRAATDVVASAFHVLPRGILARLRLIMRSVVIDAGFDLKTAARSRNTTEQDVRIQRVRVSAVAETEPLALTFTELAFDWAYCD